MNGSKDLQFLNILSKMNNSPGKLKLKESNHFIRQNYLQNISLEIRQDKKFNHSRSAQELFRDTTLPYENIKHDTLFTFILAVVFRT